jgi:DNA-binding response OmpR family regulator
MRKKILVVEDDAELVELLSYQLKTAGFAIGTAMDGIEALKKARTVAPDLILLDLMLPELDGFAVCEILRRDAATASIPIIMVTALSTQLARLAGLEAGANAYVTKPFEFKGLLNQINVLLSPALANPPPQATTSHSSHSPRGPV